MAVTLQSVIDYTRKLAIDMGNALQLRGFKTGGTVGQVPIKADGTDFNWSWGTIDTTITTSTSTTFTGLIKGNGATLEGAVAGTDYAGIASNNSFEGNIAFLSSGAISFETVSISYSSGSVVSAHRTALGLGIGDSPSFTNLTLTGGLSSVGVVSSSVCSAKFFAEGVTAIGTCGSAETITITGGSNVTATLDDNTPCTFTLPAPAAGLSFILFLRQATSGTATTATFTDVIWSGGTAPTITPTLGQMDILTFVSGPNAAGSGYDWYGSVIQNFTPV